MRLVICVLQWVEPLKLVYILKFVYIQIEQELYVPTLNQIIQSKNALMWGFGFVEIALTNVFPTIA